MDGAQGPDPAAAGAGDDWRSHLQPEARGRIVNKIMETLKKHLPVSVPEGQSELQKIAVRFEEKMYAAATNQSDYLRKISLKMLSMEGQSQNNTEQNPQNAQVVQNQRPRSLGAADWKEELYQMNNTLKGQYMAGLSDLYEIYMKLPVDNHMPPQKPTNQYDGVKSFKLMLEGSLHSFQIGKSCVQLALEENVPMYKRKITNIVNSQGWMPEETFQQSLGHAPSTSSSGIQHALGTLSPERINVKRLRPSPNDDIHS